MVQLIENHAEIEGELISIKDDATLAGFVTLRVIVRQVEDVEGMPNFFAGELGRTIGITARRDSPLAARHAGPIRILVKKTGPASSFAEAELPIR